MSINRHRLFWNEVDLIQLRHSIFFPDSQKQYIEIKHVNQEYKLVFLPGCNLSSVILLEIEFAFKISFS
jgi:hypothetical protein